MRFAQTTRESPRLLIPHYVARYTSGEMKIEQCAREEKRELTPSTRIQITSSNATSATTTTLAGAVLYAKRSCNPALARGACAGVCTSRASEWSRACLRFAMYDTFRRDRTRIRAHGICSLCARTCAHGCVYVCVYVCVFWYATPDRAYPWFKNIIYSTADRARVAVHRLAIRP